MNNLEKGPTITDTTVDLLVIGSGTGLSAALAAHDEGLEVLVVEKTAWVGGSTARSGGAFWIPANPVLLANGSHDSLTQASIYLDAVVGDSAPKSRREAFLEEGAATVQMLERLTPMRLMWSRGYSDYQPEEPGGTAVGRTCECKPFDASVLGDERRRLRPGVAKAPVPMPVTGADYKWINLMLRTPLRALPRIVQRLVQGIGGKLIGRDYVAIGQALAAGLFAGVIKAKIPVYTRTAAISLITHEGHITGVVVEQDGRRATITARKGVVLASGGFDHNMAMRHQYQSARLEPVSLGAEGNQGDGLTLGRSVGGDTTLMEQAWWFPAIAPAGDEGPQILLAERSLPGSFMVDQHGRRFINEAVGYMSFGQQVLAREHANDPVTTMWLVFDQTYRRRYIMAGSIFPGMPLPESWYAEGVAVRSDSPTELARRAGIPEQNFSETLTRFNQLAASGEDADFHRGNSAYDRYYGDPTVTPNPNLRPLSGQLYAVKVVLSDLGTCGGLKVDEHARVLRDDGSVIEKLYAIGNVAGNVFGHCYPGAGGTIGQGLVFGRIAARHAAAQL